MKLRNKTTGWITEDIMIDSNEGEGIIISGICYDKISDIANEWEDFEEPKKKWLITEGGYILGYSPEIKNEGEKIGNCFETKEEAQKAVKKLKAWKRLKDLCQFSFNGIITNSRGKISGVKVAFDERPATFKEQEQAYKDLYLLFGGENDTTE